MITPNEQENTPKSEGSGLNQTFTEDDLIQAHNQDGLKMPELLAGYILGKLILMRYVNRIMLEGDGGDGLKWILTEIAEAITEAMPHMDMIALERLHDRQSEDRKQPKS